MLILTKQERLVLLSLSLVLFFGSVFRFAFKVYPELMHLINLTDNGKVISKVNINEATKEELIDIPYIGEYTARQIMEYRKKRGPFTDIKQVMEIRGIREANFKIFSRYLKI